MKILPVVSSGEAVLRTDGSVEVVPFQVLRTPGGRTVIRIGRTTFWFTEKGEFDGPEHLMSGLTNEQKQTVLQTLEDTKRNRGRAPAEPYFQPGTQASQAELAGWPKEDPAPKQSPVDETRGPKVYTIRGVDKRPGRPGSN